MSERNEIPDGLMITEGITMANGETKVYSFGNPILSDPSKTFGPKVVSARIAEQEKGDE